MGTRACSPGKRKKVKVAGLYTLSENQRKVILNKQFYFLDVWLSLIIPAKAK